MTSLQRDNSWIQSTPPPSSSGREARESFLSNESSKDSASPVSQELNKENSPDNDSFSKALQSFRSRKHGLPDDDPQDQPDNKVKNQSLSTTDTDMLVTGRATAWNAWHDDDDDDSVPIVQTFDSNLEHDSPSENSNNSSQYQDRKSFWMKFLDGDGRSSTQASSSHASEEFSPRAVFRSRRTSTMTEYTQVGKTVEKTLTTGSPLSEASAYNDERSADETSSSFKDNDLVVDATSPDKIPSAIQSEEPLVNDSLSLDPQTPEKVEVTKSSPTSEPRSLSPEPNHTKPLSTVQSARKLFEQQSQSKIAKQQLQREQLKPKGTAFSPKSENQKAQIQVEDTQQLTETNKALPLAVDNNSPVKKVFKAKSSAFPKIQHGSTFQRSYDAWYRAGLMKQRVVKPESSGEVETAKCEDTNKQPIPESNNESVSPMKDSASVEPSTKDVSKQPKVSISSMVLQGPEFQRSYDAWFRAGLMKERVGDSELTPMIKLETPQDEEADEIKKAKEEVVERALKLARESIGSHQDMDILSPSSARVAQVIETKSEFLSLLGQWRKQIDSQQNSHFLSKPSRTGDAESIFRGIGIESKDSMTKKIQTFDKDHFDHVRQSDSNDSLGDIESKIKNTLRLADTDTVEGSFAEHEERNRAFVVMENQSSYQIMVGDSRSGSMDDNGLEIRNVELLASSGPDSGKNDSGYCRCSKSVFSGNDELTSFFLPQLGMACTCGLQQYRMSFNAHDPMAIENVLRPWQVSFLKSFGIHRGEQLVKARHRSGAILAKALREWRKKEGMLPFRTSSCKMAIDIWAKTCKVYVRSIRKQLENGEDLLDGRPQEVRNEMNHFLGDLPSAPQRKTASNMLRFDSTSEVEV